MNFTVSKQQLYSALQEVNHAVPSNTPLPALKGIKIQATDTNSLILTASDSDISIQKVLNNETNEGLNLVIDEPGSVVIDAKYVLDIVHKIDSDRISVEIIDGALTMFTGNTAQFRINGMRSSDYPTIDLSKPATEIRMKANLLSTIIDETCFAASDKETRPVLTGVNFHAHDGKLECTATDSFRLARKVIEFDQDVNFNITIPAKSLNQVKSILLGDGEQEIVIAENEKKAQFLNDSIIFQTRLLDGGFPETNRLIPTDFSYILTVDRASFIGALDRSMFIKNDNMTVNRLQCSQDDIIFSSSSQEIGEFKQSLLQDGATFEGEPLDISFSGVYVLQAVRALKSDKVVIKFNSEMKPFILVNPEDSSILQLALPVRTYN